MTATRTRRFLLYGATGFSGRLIAESAGQHGLSPILAGRDGARLARLARELGLGERVVALDDPSRLQAALDDVDLVLNAAGPFAATARPLVDACLATRTHYADIAGELPVLEEIAARHAQAKSSGVMLMPATGFVVVPSDCLAAHVARRLPGAERLALGVSRTDAVSGGSLRTIVEQWSDTVAVRRRGVLRTLPAGRLERRFDYGQGPRRSTAVSWGDLATAHHTTGIPDVEVYLEVSPSERAMFRLSARLGRVLEAPALRHALAMPARLVAGDEPTPRRRAASGRVLVAEARDRSGRSVAARLRTPEAYGFTATTALAVADRVLHGDWEAGFQTPARLYGPDFVLAMPGVVREDIAG